jgi:Sap, sulfolipid-1-addressing protein
VSDLTHTMVVCGLVSGTQPLTMMGLMVVIGGANGRRNAWFYIAGAFSIQAVIVLVSGFVIGGTVDQSSTPGRTLVGVRILAGLVLLCVGWRFRRPSKDPAPETPKVLDRLTNLRPFDSFVAGAVIADYTGAVLAAGALAASPIKTSQAVSAWLIYCLFATGLLVVATIAIRRSSRAENDLQRGIAWVFSHRRPLISWICLLAGLALVSDGLWSLAAA